MATNAQFKLAKELPERSSWQYSATLLDVDGLPIPLASINALTLTIYDLVSGAIINGVNQVNIRDLGRGRIGSLDGTLIIHFTPDDTVIIGTIPVGSAETHIALVQCTYNGGSDAWNRELVHKVTNLARIT